MKILGISSNYHDASAALVIDGKVIASAAEERFSYEKHDPSFPEHSIAFCLQEGGISTDELDYVIYHEDPQTKFTRSLSSSFKNFPFSMNSFIKSAKDLLSVGFWIKNDISKSLNIAPQKIIFAPHHISHATHAFLTSPYDEAAIVTIDAVGEWSTSCIFKGVKKGEGYTIEPMDLIPFPHSLGLVYSAFTGFLGFKVNDGECSTMALAAFGKPLYADQIRKIIQCNLDGTFQIDLSYFDFTTNDKLPLTKKFLQVFGKPRGLSETIEYSSLEDKEVRSDDQVRYANIASSIQMVLEEAVVSYIRRAQHLTGLKNLCYAGGVALNCVANSKIIQAQIFENVYIPPDPGDGGGAMGAALYGSMVHDRKNAGPTRITPYLGKSYLKNDDLISLVRELDPTNWHRHTLLKVEALKKNDLSIVEYTSERELTKFIARQLQDRKIIGWFQGRFENGPRALGNRSILCRPDCIVTAQRLSSTIKLRSSFRPYACSILHEHAEEYFEDMGNYQLSNWMQSSFKIKKNKVEKIRAACHVDHTTRAQVLKKEENELYYDLINEFSQLSGVPALLNTSFNLQGFPIVTNPYDALFVFAKTNLDMVVINRIVISKRDV